MTISPVILLGGQRCGTTALAYAMNLAFHDAGGHFTVNGKLPYLLHRWLGGQDLADRHLRADEILHALDRRPPDGAGVEQWRARVERSLRAAARDVAEGAAGDDPVELARRILGAAQGESPYWGDKYNEYLLHLPWFGRVLPDARYVMLVRHPVEAARSMLRWKGDRPYVPLTEEAALAKWTAWNRHWLAFAPGVPAERRLVVEYHALCRGRRPSGCHGSPGSISRRTSPASSPGPRPPTPASSCRRTRRPCGRNCAPPPPPPLPPHPPDLSCPDLPDEPRSA